MSSDFPTDKTPRESIGFEFWKAFNFWRKKHQEALKPFGLSHGQFVILACSFYLGETGEKEVSQKDISNFSQVDEMTTSQVITSLVKKELVEKIRSEKDRRAYVISCTPKGRNLVQETMPIVEGNDELFFNTVGKEKSKLFLEMLLELQGC